MNKYWFAPKRFGYGYVPISIEGWIATIILIFIGLLIGYINNIFNPTNINFYDSLFFVGEIILLGFIFLKLFEKRCKGKLKWNWK
ncbi:hypothetical protein M0R19_00925 [Candidatus Pacearchaeota archaeon]|jgi:uncharacterized protein YacL|nr:hypothetical protein [Candidatus Pacearchaeota archaeon]